MSQVFVPPPPPHNCIPIALDQFQCLSCGKEAFQISRACYLQVRRLFPLISVVSLAMAGETTSSIVAIIAAMTKSFIKTFSDSQLFCLHHL